MEKVEEDNLPIEDLNSFEEIDLRQLYDNLLRYKKLISVSKSYRRLNRKIQFQSSFQLHQFNNN